MTGTDLCVNKPVTVPVIFEPPCIWVERFRGYSLLCSRLQINIQVRRILYGLMTAKPATTFPDKH